MVKEFLLLIQHLQVGKVLGMYVCMFQGRMYVCIFQGRFPLYQEGDPDKINKTPTLPNKSIQ